jgi:hypothetical protein
MDMKIEERKRYNVVVFTVFVLFLSLYGWIGLVVGEIDPPGISFTVPCVLSPFLLGFLGGWWVASLVGGIWLGCKFVAKQKKVFIILACVFFMFTLMIFCVIGVFKAIPLAIRNIPILKEQKQRGL